MWEQIKPEKIIEGEKYHFMDSQKFVHIGELENGVIVNSKTKVPIKNIVRIWK
jgi:hypothetical protein